MLRALLYLRLTSLVNLVAYRVSRLRQPKYLFGLVVAVLYFYFVFFRRVGAVRVQVASAPALADAGILMVGGFCAVGALLGLMRIAYIWIAPPETPGLRFSEAEIAFLFPAPATRRTLIHFRLVSAQVAILFTSLLIVFFFRRFGNTGGSRLIQAVGWWVILSTLDLHVNGTNLTLARLKQRGRGYGLWRLGAVAVIAAYIGAVAWLSVAYFKSHPSSLAAVSGSREFLGFLKDMLAWAPLHWLLLPFRVLFAPYFASGAQEFALAIGPALVLVGAHYLWVAGSEVRFEEGSITMAEKRAALRSAMLRGDSPIQAGSRPRPLPGPFPLPPTAPPEVAFFWKNLLSMRSSLMNRRTLILSLWVMFCLSIATKPILAANARSNGIDYYGPGIVMLCAVLSGYTLLAGPQIARQDLRTDLPSMDILKTYPIPGWRLALGELLAPTLVLSGVLWLCIIATAFTADSRGQLDWLTPAVRVIAALCLAAAAPVLCFLQLLVPNTIMVLMPGWYQASRSRGGGIELMGQRLILGVGQLLIALLVAAPAGFAAGLVIFSTHWILGVGAALVLALAAVLAILGSEAVIALWWLGERIEKFDLSAER